MDRRCGTFAARLQGGTQRRRWPCGYVGVLCCLMCLCSLLAAARQVYLCERCGWAHVCGDACVEDATGGASELRVCPISGRCFEKLVVEWGEARAAPLAVAGRNVDALPPRVGEDHLPAAWLKGWSGLTWRGDAGRRATARTKASRSLARLVRLPACSGFHA